MPFVPELKILGVIFDWVLSFPSRVKHLKQHISSLTLNLKSLAGLQWGVTGAQFCKLYLQCLEKMSVYAAPVWWSETGNSRLLRSVISVQRVPLLRISHAYYTLPNISLPVLCNVLLIESVLK